jgi:hypothetical protein
MPKLITSVVIFVAGFVLSAVIGGRNLASLAKGNFSSPAALATTTQNAQPSTSQKWEYRVVTRYISPNQKDIDFELNRLGEQGFEVCGVVQSGAGPTILTIVFRRSR